MKRFLFLVLALMALLLVGCGAEELTPFEKCRARVVEIGQQYLDFEISAADACEALDGISVPDAGGSSKLYLEVDIGALSFKILKGESYEAIAEKVEYIRDRNYTY